MCLWRAPEKYIAGAALDRAAIDLRFSDDSNIHKTLHFTTVFPRFSVGGKTARCGGDDT
jgi:hypothetical protein